jgi:glycosyltransferase involved in cell wall biosynthesis
VKLAIVTNIPAPYRIPIYNRISEKMGKDFLAIYCAELEDNRQWTLSEIKYRSTCLKENVYKKKDGYNYVHNNPDVLKHLIRFKPDVVITTGFNPTHLYAWLYTLFFRKKHIPMTDGWLHSESNLGSLHRIIRRIVFNTSDAFIGASKNSLTLFESYGISNDKFFQSHLCIDNKQFANESGFKDRPYHIMFSGQFHERKLPLFFAEIACALTKKIQGLNVLILGDGPLKKEFFQKLDSNNVNYTYAGYVNQSDLPKYYASSKLFLFTTRLDAWGLVVNEALASATPVISTPYTGVINDLLVDAFNGRIMDLDINAWSNTVLEILENESLWKKLSLNAVHSVQRFNFDTAADGIIKASEQAFSNA